MYVESLVVQTYDQAQNSSNFLREIDGASNDLNKDFGGKYSYLKVNYTDDITKAASGFSIISKDTAWPVYGKDFAEGAGGNYRYINTHSPGDYAVKKGDIYLWRSSAKKSNPATRGFTEKADDLNHGREKDYLNVCWKKTSSTLDLVEITLGTFIPKGQKPKVVHETVINNSASDVGIESIQTWTFMSSYQESVTIDAGFKYHNEIALKASTGIFPGGEATGTTGFELSVNVSGTISSTNSKEEKSEVIIKVPKAAKVKFTALIFETMGEVPFTMHFKDGSTRKGEWKGIVNSKNTFSVENI